MEVNHSDLKQTSEKDQTVFVIGREVEAIARSLFPNAHLVDKESNKEKRLQTESFLRDFPKDPIFEASFLFNNVHIQIDILIPKEDGSYKAIEVKSSSKLKPEYLEDTAIQYHVVDGEGKIKITEYEVWHINTQGSKTNIFTAVSVLDQIIPMKESVEKMRTEAQATIDRTEAPVISVGKHCDKPYGCPFKHICWKAIEDKKDHILHLPFFEKKWELYSQGVETMDDERFKVGEYSHPEILNAIKTNSLFIKPKEILDIFSQWQAPFHFFDFEALMHYLPIFEGTRPYEQVAIQYSLHVMNDFSQRENYTHKEWLHDNLSSPKKILIDKLIEDLGTEGSIVTYNMTYEKTRVKDLIKLVEDDETKVKLLSIIDRFVDLKDVIKDNLYHPDFKGGFSLKVVSPTLLGFENGGYTDSLIKSGSEVTRYYLEFINTSDLSRKEELRQAFLKYCGYDTINLILLTHWIRDLALKESVKISVA